MGTDRVGWGNGGWNEIGVGSGINSERVDSGGKGEKKIEDASDATN